MAPISEENWAVLVAGIPVELKASGNVACPYTAIEGVNSSIAAVELEAFLGLNRVSEGS